MKENSIISINNLDAIEVRENNRLAPRYGTDKISFSTLRKEEQEVIRKCEEILKKKELPLSLCNKLEELGAKDMQEETQSVFIVLEKATELLKQGFHVLIIRGMLGCACGHKSSLGYGAFDEKFTRALTDIDFRKELWGTESLLSIEAVSSLLLDLINSADIE